MTAVDPDRPTGSPDLLDGLDDDQRLAVTIDAAPLAILAGAGSGKTRVLTRRIAHRVATGQADPDHTLVVTFTRRAARELRDRLRALGLRGQVRSGTFHGLAWAMLRQYWAEQRRPVPDLLDRKLVVLAPVVDDLVGPRRSTPAVAAEVAAEIEWAKARLVPPIRYEAAATAAGRRPSLSRGLVAEAYRRYEEAKRSRRLVDLDDLLWRGVQAFEREPAFADVERWRARHLFVDEFQDVNPLQFRFLEGLRHGRPDLCVVGDPNQAIYGWNGADPTLLAEIHRHVPGTTVVRLRANHRTSPQVLAVAQAVLDLGPSPSPAQVPCTADGPVPAVWACRDEAHEARVIAEVLRDAHDPGTPWRAMAVLARTNAQLAALEPALRAAGIPCRLRGSGALAERAAVQAWIRRQPRGIPLVMAVADLQDDLAGPAEPGEPPPPPELHALVELATDYLATDPTATVPAFATWLATSTRHEGAARGDAVDLATFHAAKGLEWPVVVIAGMEQGLVPVSGAPAGSEAWAEELRLLYVAITRARRMLHLTWAAHRGGSGREPSPWLPAVEATIRRLAEPADPATVRALIARARSGLSATAPPAGR